MQKFFKKNVISILLAIMLTGFGFAGNVFAGQTSGGSSCLGTPGELLVYVKDDTCPLTSSHNTPLFNETDIAPGYSITGTLRVKNVGADPQTVIIEAVDFADPIPDEDLARALNIAISLQGVGGYVYNNTLANFFQEREYELAKNFVSGADNIYDVVVSFPADKGDYWQGKTTGFGVMIGFQGSDSKGVTLTTISGGGSTGGQVRGLIIQNEMVVTTTADSATITWTTSHAATSWVIYAKEGEEYTFDLTKSNYGYPYSFPIPEDPNKVISHSVTILGLDSGTTYHYRCVSHGSLAVSVDHSFTTLAPGRVAGAETEKKDESAAIANNQVSNGADAGEASESAPGRVAGAETEKPDEVSGNNQKSEDAKTNSGVAEICRSNFPWWSFLILAAVCAGRAWANKKTRWLWLAAGIVPLAISVWIYFSKICVDWKLFAAVAVILLIAYLADRNRK